MASKFFYRLVDREGNDVGSGEWPITEIEEAKRQARAQRCRLVEDTYEWDETTDVEGCDYTEDEEGEEEDEISYILVRHVPSGEVYAVEMHGERIVATAGPLYHEDASYANLPPAVPYPLLPLHMAFTTENAEWLDGEQKTLIERGE